MQVFHSPHSPIIFREHKDVEDSEDTVGKDREASLESGQPYLHSALAVTVHSTPHQALPLSLAYSASCLLLLLIYDSLSNAPDSLPMDTQAHQTVICVHPISFVNGEKFSQGPVGSFQTN